MTRALVWCLAVAGVYLALVAGLILAGRRTIARELAMFLPNLVVLFRGLLRDPAVPRRAKIWLAVGLVWLISPIDLVPEFLPVIGAIDDALIAALVLRSIVKHAGRDVVRAHWRGDERAIERVLRFARAPL